MPDEISDAYDRAYGSEIPNETDDDTPEVAAKPTKDDSEERPSEAGADEDDDDGEAAEDKDDDEDPDASDSKPETDKDGDDSAFDKGLYDALKDNPELTKTLKGYEDERRDARRKIDFAEIVFFDAPVPAFADSFKMMAEARTLSPEAFASQILEHLGVKPASGDAPAAKPGAEGLDPSDPKPTEPDFDRWDEEGFESRGEMKLDHEMKLLRWENRERDRRQEAKEKAAEESRKAEIQRQQQDQKLEAQSKTVAQRVKAETGWDLAPAKVLKALKTFPTLDPIHACKAQYPDDFAKFKASVKGKAKRADTLPTTGNRNPETRSDGDEDLYDRAARMNAGG